MVSDASCSWQFDFDQRGAFVEVKQALSPGGTYTILQITDNDNDPAVGIKAVDQASLILFDTAQSPEEIAMLDYDASTMQWWRLRPDQNGRIIGEYSADAIEWNQLGITSETTTERVGDKVSLNGGTFVSVIEPGVAEFDNFNICP